MKRDATAPTIGLLDHMGYGNLGDAAIQDAVIASIRTRLPDARLVGFSFVPDDTTRRHGIPCHPIRWWYPTLGEPAGAGKARSRRSGLKHALKRRRRLYTGLKAVADLLREARFWIRSYRALRRLDVLVISGGGQLGELWRGPWSHPYAIFKFSLLAKLARRKLYFLNVGAGPLHHPLSRFFARWAVRLADYRSFRDDDSRELVRRLGVKGAIHVYPDPVYALDVRPHRRRRPASPAAPVVGLNPIGFGDPRVWARRDARAYHAYLDTLDQFSAWLLEHGYDLRVFSNELSVDRYAIDDLQVRLAARLEPEAIARMFRTPSGSVHDVLAEMSGFDFVVTSKFHGIVFAHLLGKPVIGVSYHPKMDAAMRAFGQQRFCGDIEHVDAAWLVDAFQALVKDGASIRSECGVGVAACAARLTRQFDELFTRSRLFRHVTTHEDLR